MSRSNYSTDIDNWSLIRWRGAVKKAIKGKRGQSFLRELAEVMDAMPEKRLIADELVDASGDMCAIGAVCQSRGVDIDAVDYWEPEEVGAAVGIAKALAAEIEFENDEGTWRRETPEERWSRMRQWVGNNIAEQA